jgi:predicted nucleic acid-binding protein
MTAARSASIEWVGFSAITRLEVLGFRGLGSEDERGLRELLAQFNEVSVTPDIIDEAIRIRKIIRMDTPDAIIAATALVCQAQLITRNVTDFQRVTRLMVVAPATL